MCEIVNVIMANDFPIGVIDATINEKEKIEEIYKNMWEKHFKSHGNYSYPQNLDEYKSCMHIRTYPFIINKI